MMAMHRFACLRSEAKDMGAALFPHAAAPSLINSSTTAATPSMMLVSLQQQHDSASCWRRPTCACTFHASGSLEHPIAPLRHIQISCIAPVCTLQLNSLQRWHKALPAQSSNVPWRCPRAPYTAGLAA